MQADASQASLPRRRAVDGGVLHFLSVSQLKQFSLCPRRWYFAKVLRLPEPETKAQALGVEGHAQLEHYLRTGEDVLGDIARAGLHLLPTPGDDLLVEESFGTPPTLSADGVPFVGHIDLINPRRLADGVLRVTDHKFSSNVARYAATPSQLVDASTESGLQMVGYGVWAALSEARFPGVRVLELEHLYFQTRGARRAVSVMATVRVEDVTREWTQKVFPMVRSMSEVARATRAADVSPNFNACQKYGGCPFKAQCISGERTMSLLNRFMPKSQASDTAAQLPLVPPPVPVTSTEALGTCDRCGATLTMENTSKLRSGDVLHVSCPGAEVAAVLPPDAPAASPTIATEAAPKRRGRKPKVQAAPVPSSPVEEHKATTASSAPSAQGERLRLFVDCVPNMAAESLSEYVAKVASQVSEAGGVEDLRFAGGESALGYGRWKGALAMAIRNAPPTPRAYAALGLAHSELLQIAVEALEPLCGPGDFVRGAR
ncbi:PD-(D/E)XK nuclease family protein [Myxococcus sp. K38C18041901]|uniref:PD-(D/E)XK nuclease family protein n=1 Tax=Myxococcus guangdongensis TaxID=2906760 RepID=UPI0020A81122|nr:PD-(D/E)XK nuclease family protein [Myxococcus guangdongensis]MCP3060958.1 PD-(D/E)XK nuclease family protein [Myxococcus guangdongensis]